MHCQASRLQTLFFLFTMATLTRIQNLISSRRTSPIPVPAVLAADIPSPFPSLLDRHSDTGELIATESQDEPTRSSSPPLAPIVTVELAEPSRITDAVPRDAVSRND